MERLRFYIHKTPKALISLLLALVITVSASLPALADTAQGSSEPLLVTGGHDPYMVGQPGGIFAPEQVMLRSEAAQVLYNLLRTRPSGVSTVFSDVPSNQWYAEAVNALAQLDVIRGIGNGLFDPSGKVTRAAFVTLLCKCFGLSSGEKTFTDVPANHWAYDFIAAAADAGWISGVGDGSFQPDRGITRAEVTVVLNRALDRVNTEGYAADRGSQKFLDVPKTHMYFLDITEAATPESSSGNPAFAVGQQVRVIAQSGLYLRRTPAVSSNNAITVLTYGTTLTVINASRQDWLGVRTEGGDTGYVSAEFVELVPAEVVPPGPGPVEGNESLQVGQTVCVTASSGLYLRDAPKGNALEVLPVDTSLTIVDVKDSEWPQVRKKDGTTGYASAAYLEVYVPGKATVATLSTRTVSIMQYQSFRLDAAVDDGMETMSWTSSNPGVAKVGYTVSYNAREHGAMIYGVAPGTATLTFANDDGSVSVTCVVTVTAPEPVRFAFSAENAAQVGVPVDLVAVTDTSRSSVTFQVTGGGSYTTSTYTTEVHTSTHGLGSNTVRVFKYPATFSQTGTYTVRAVASGDSTAKTFQVFVQPNESATTASFAERRTSTSMLRVIANFEGAISEVYDDPLARKNPTVGYGYVVPVNTAFYNNLTSTELFGLLVDKVNNGGYASAVNTFRRSNNLKMSQAQFDALVSFVYNLGSGSLSTGYGAFRAMCNGVTPPVNASEEQPSRGYLNVSGATVYTAHDLASESIVELDNGTFLDVVGVWTNLSDRSNEIWYQVRVEDTEEERIGWIPAGYVRLLDTQQIDLTYTDATVFANNYLQWSTAGGARIAGLVWRRMAELKIFFFGNYSEAFTSNSSYELNTYGFNFPDVCKQYDRR